MTERPLGMIFDEAAASYHRARPRYPAELFDALDDAVGGLSGCRVLEIGPATGVATEDLVSRGAVISAIEPGAALAEWFGVELVETEVVVGDRTLTSGQLLISLYSDDTVSGTSVSRSDIFVLNVTDTGSSTAAISQSEPLASLMKQSQA